MLVRKSYNAKFSCIKVLNADVSFIFYELFFRKRYVTSEVSVDITKAPKVTRKVTTVKTAIDLGINCYYNSFKLLVNFLVKCYDIEHAINTVQMI